MSLSTQDERLALTSVPRHQRVEWFKTSGCAKCADCTSHGYDACASVSHWKAPMVSRAYAALVAGTVTPKNDAPAPTPATSKDPGLALIELIQRIAGEVVQKIDIDGIKDEVAELIDQKLNGMPPKEIAVRFNDRDAVKFDGAVNEKFERCLKIIASRVPLFLVGPTGSGKTTLARQLAAAVSARKYAENVCSPIMGERHIMGSLLPVGVGGQFLHITTEALDVIENGGVLCIDEVDNLDPAFGVGMNAIVDPDTKTLSCPMRHLNPIITKHKDLIIIITANTYGTGPNRVYVGRVQQDAAFLNRFVMGTTEIDYCASLEEKIVPAQILKWGREVRAIINSQRLKQICGTRNLIHAARMEAADVLDWKTNFFGNWSADDLAKMPSHLLPR